LFKSIPFKKLASGMPSVPVNKVAGRKPFLKVEGGIAC
jgi:hypothetical protein